MNKLYSSHMPEEQNKEIVNQIGQTLRKRGTVISDKYLHSPNCMFELVETVDTKQFLDQIFPVILSDALTYDPIKRIEDVKYWRSSGLNWPKP